MSLDAFVHCTCYKEGKTTKPPHAEYLVYDEDGYHLEFPKGMWDANMDGCMDMEFALNDWMVNACEHEDMLLVDERIANISGLAEFRHTLRRMGGEARFPTLLEHVKDGASGWLPKHQEATMLNELDDLAKDKSKEEKRFLRVIPELEVLACVAADSFWIFGFMSDGLMYGLDGSGFLVLKKDEEHGDGAFRVHFSAVVFTQDPVPEGGYVLRNIYSGEHLWVEHAVWTDPNDPQRTVDLNVQFSERSVSRYYSGILNDLRKVVKAAIETGNPVHWS